MNQKNSPRQKGQTQIILIGVLLIAMVGAGVFYLGGQTFPKSTPTPAVSPTPQSTSSPDETVNTEATRSTDWKTYENTKYGYSIKYPSEKAFRIVTKRIPERFGERDFEELRYYKENGQLLMTINIVTETTSTKDIFELAKEQGIGDFEKINSYDTLVVADDTGQGSASYTLINKGIMYELYTDIPTSFEQMEEKEITELLRQFKQILSTFKFIDNNIECPTPPPCKDGDLIHGDPGPDEPDRCPRYFCSQSK